MLKNNDKAPDFKLIGNDSKEYTLESFKNKKLILYFYPKDNTPGCTIQATDFTKYKKDFEKIGYTVIGISSDDTKSHCNFTKKHNLEILLLSDLDKKVMEKYSVLKGSLSLIKVNRSTFILNEDHIITQAMYGVKSKEHAKILLEQLK